MNRPVRIHLRVCAEFSVFAVLRLVGGNGCLVVEYQSLVSVRQVDGSVEIVSVGAFHRTGYVVVAETCPPSEGVVSAGKVEIVSLTDSHPDRLTDPISVHSSVDILEILMVEILECHIRSHVILIVIHTVLIFKLKLLPGVHQIV